jgi:hypothetical protein
LQLKASCSNSMLVSAGSSKVSCKQQNQQQRLCLARTCMLLLFSTTRAICCACVF